MNTNDMISKIKEVLNLSEEVKLEQQALENGTVLEAEAFESGNEVFIVTEDEKVAVPVGEYQLEDGRILVVAEEGLISEIKTEEAEEEAPAEEVEASEDVEFEEIKAMLEPKEDLSAEELGNLITEELCKHEKVELSEVPEEVQEELNQPAAEPIQANPEAKQNLSKFNISQNRRMSTLDRVMAKFNN